MRYSQFDEDAQKDELRQMIAQREQAHFRLEMDIQALQPLAADDAVIAATIPKLRQEQARHEKAAVGLKAALQKLNDPDRPKPNRAARRKKA